MASSPVQVKVVAARPDLFALARSVLSPSQFRRGLYQATRRTTQAGTRIVRDIIQKQVDIPLKYIKKAIFTKVQGGDIPVGTIEVSHEGLPLIAFGPSVSKKTGVVAKLATTRPALTLRHAFRATMKSGHKGIFYRLKLSVVGLTTSAQDLQNAGFPDWEAKQLAASIRRGNFIGQGIRHQKRLAAGGNFPGVTSGGFAQRLPIAESFGPSPFNVADTEEAKREALTQLGDRYEREILGQIDRFTKGQKPDTSEVV